MKLFKLKVYTYPYVETVISDELSHLLVSSVSALQPELSASIVSHLLSDLFVFSLAFSFIRKSESHNLARWIQVR